MFIPSCRRLNLCKCISQHRISRTERGGVGSVGGCMQYYTVNWTWDFFYHWSLTGHSTSTHWGHHTNTDTHKQSGFDWRHDSSLPSAKTHWCPMNVRCNKHHSSTSLFQQVKSSLLPQRQKTTTQQSVWRWKVRSDLFGFDLIWFDLIESLTQWLSINVIFSSSLVYLCTSVLN